MTQTKVVSCTTFIALTLFAGVASAHSGDHGSLTGFTAGLAHPLLGWDHLLALVAAGLWAAQQGGRALWVVPAAYAGALALGAGIAVSGLIFSHVETLVALSVLASGLLVATRCHWRAGAGALVAAGFALAHGYVHGLEIPLGSAPLAYGLGFVLATLGLQAMTITGALLWRRSLAWAGIGIAASGLALILAA